MSRATAATFGRVAQREWDRAWERYILARRAGDEAGIAEGKRRLRELDPDFADRIFGRPAVAAMRESVRSMAAVGGGR
ncbi:MAG TPA: hypothetical protein VFU97_24265, partial [Xanthobacteraceae bacterium]|nr:hypothetical protein [Xanthobacteraceae bacterium]